MSSFSELGLKQELLEGVEHLGFTEPTKVQELAIPTILNSKQDLVALAQTAFFNSLLSGTNRSMF